MVARQALGAINMAWPGYFSGKICVLGMSPGQTRGESPC